MIKEMPCYKEIKNIIKGLRSIIFNDHYKCEEYTKENVKEALKKQIEIALKANDQDLDASMITEQFFSKFDTIKTNLFKDAQAGYEGDPAANSIDEVIIAYPGMFAIYVHRIAHELISLQVPLIPRMMSEYAHSKTGIDIHPKATIGNYFFIDHGTGVVIGETSVIGNYVKIYQGVTLGALSTKGGQKLKDIKRHPTIEDNVTIYANATILGGNTIIGKNSVIGGNTFIIDSIKENSKVMPKY